ncbi:hypothetical protein [Leifsonia sp. AG29]|uniref:hypothetical protein n=1 Tax=Leifsonia sp. AG29 TaxID=2598860 RepID=UPI00131CD53C|nr:hypothetical protein [Leifsonia sp. AG29]
MNPITPSDGGRPSRSELADFAARLEALGPQTPVFPRTIVSIDAGHLFHSLGTGADLTLPSGAATGDTLFAPNLNPAFFYSWDVHTGQPPDWFRVTVRFTPADFGIQATSAYLIEWIVLPFFLDPGAELTAQVSVGGAPQTVTLNDQAVTRVRIGSAPIPPGETLTAELIRSSAQGSWIWLRTDIGFPPLTNEP